LNNDPNSGERDYLIPPHQRDALRKCGDCGHIWVGNLFSACPACAQLRAKFTAVPPWVEDAAKDLTDYSHLVVVDGDFKEAT
jgi:hypothetical protein